MSVVNLVIPKKFVRGTKVSSLQGANKVAGNMLICAIPTYKVAQNQHTSCRNAQLFLAWNLTYNLVSGWEYQTRKLDEVVVRSLDILFLKPC